MTTPQSVINKEKNTFSVFFFFISNIKHEKERKKNDDESAGNDEEMDTPPNKKKILDTQAMRRKEECQRNKEVPFIRLCNFKKLAKTAAGVCLSGSFVKHFRCVAQALRFGHQVVQFLSPLQYCFDGVVL